MRTQLWALTAKARSGRATPPLPARTVPPVTHARRSEGACTELCPTRAHVHEFTPPAGRAACTRYTLPQDAQVLVVYPSSRTSYALHYSRSQPRFASQISHQTPPYPHATPHAPRTTPHAPRATRHAPRTTHHTPAARTSGTGMNSTAA